MLRLYLITLVSINPPSLVHGNEMHPVINMKQGPIFTVSQIKFNNAALVANLVIFSFNVHIHFLYFIYGWELVYHFLQQSYDHLQASLLCYSWTKWSFTNLRSKLWSPQLLKYY